jgi:uncharacterized membrane protein
LYTPAWGGTDVFLWAAVPWVLVLVTRPSTQRTDLTAGILSGAAVLMRYASVFLVPYVLGVIPRPPGGRRRNGLRRTLVYGLGLVPVVAIQVWINAFLADWPTLGGGVDLHGGSAAPRDRFWSHFPHVETANVALFFWVPRRILQFVIADTVPAHLLAAILLLALPLMVAAAIRHDDRIQASRWLIITCPLLFVELCTFLWICELLGAVGYGLETRYYTPLIPLVLPVSWLLASSETLAATTWGRIVRLLAQVYSVAFAFLALCRIAALLGSGQLASNQWSKVMGAAVRQWPASGVTYDASAARREVTALMHDDPNAILITDVDQWFYVDPPVDLSKVHRIEPCTHLSATEVSGPTELLILARDFGGPIEELFSFGQRERGHAGCFEALQPFVVIRSFPDERLKLLGRIVPSGVQLALKSARQK